MNLRFIKKFIEESDAIECIFHDGPSQYYQDHLNTAMTVINEAMEGRLVTPLSIHMLLMQEHLGDGAGKYRTEGVRVGRHIPINAIAVPYAMETWQDYVDAILNERDTLTEKEKLEYSWKTHNYFEMLHPFIDGNGRTGRLLWLACRLILGLKPQIIYESEKESYYYMLENFQKPKVKQ